FHLRHGDVHEYDVGIGAFVFGDSGHTVAGFTRHLAAESFDNTRQVLAGENGIIHYQVADGLTVLAAFQRCKLLHSSSCFAAKSFERPFITDHAFTPVFAKPTATLPLISSRACAFAAIP